MSGRPILKQAAINFGAGPGYEVEPASREGIFEYNGIRRAAADTITGRLLPSHMIAGFFVASLLSRDPGEIVNPFVKLQIHARHVNEAPFLAALTSDTAPAARTAAVQALEAAMPPLREAFQALRRGEDANNRVIGALVESGLKEVMNEANLTKMVSRATGRTISF